MTMIDLTDDVHNETREKPGQILATLREKRGVTQEFVAAKLHLRVKVIELLEADNYELMPEPVFIKGYLRAYAKLLGTPVEPLIQQFNSLCSTTERKIEKALWQGKRETHRGEHLVRLMTGLITVAVIAGVGLWWHKTKDSQLPLFSKQSTSSVQELSLGKNESEIRLTDLSKMHSMFSSDERELSPLEITGG